MSSPQVLALPNFNQPFVLECDASDNGIGAVMQQNLRLIAFTSQALGPKNQALSTYERELIAIVHAVKKWHNYLQGKHFIIKTDHNSLKYFLSQRANTHFQQKWVSKLLGFDYEIQYRSGVENTVADALSKVPNVNSELVEKPVHLDMELTAIIYPYFGWMDDLRRSFESDKWVLERIKFVLDSSKTVTDKAAVSKYTVDNGGKTVIMVMVDKLSKYAHFIALSHPYIAVSVAQIFIEFVFKLHGFTPFELVYGHAPPHIAPYEVGTAKMDYVAQSLLERDNMLTVLKHNLELAQNKMKVQVDKRRTKRHFNVGDKPRFYGPYEVLENIGMVAYKLKLPEGSKIHPVFHVSCLKKQLGEKVVSHVNLPIAADDGLMQNLPQAILARRMYKKGNATMVQLLVQWNGQEAAKASWEDFDAFKTRHPDFPV
ncbi:uncharacterized protein [Malus domestica]|uniref:uncharacterized protein n=1 Tax=Malus domestica TaxID=3750 RepID=UPI0039761F29